MGGRGDYRWVCVGDHTQMSPELLAERPRPRGWGYRDRESAPVVVPIRSTDEVADTAGDGAVGVEVVAGADPMVAVGDGKGSLRQASANEEYG